MDKPETSKPHKLGDPSSDTIIKLQNSEGRPELFYSHSSILINKSKYFADKLAPQKSAPCVEIEIQCTVLNYDHHVNLLKLLYLEKDSVLDSLESVRSALGVLQVAVDLHCEEITQSCVDFLEANPWEEKEEEEIIKVVSKIGLVAMPILARIRPVNLSAARDVFVSAMRFATSVNESFPPLGDELKTSAQEQVEYMLGEDEDAPLVIAEEEVKAVVRTGLSNICSSFEQDLRSLVNESDPLESKTQTQTKISDLEWMCNILPKMDLMKDFVLTWVGISGNVLTLVNDNKLDNLFWEMKAKLIELTGKVLEAVGYGNVILPSQTRVELLKTWLPYIRKMKPLLDSKSDEDASFAYKMDDDLCQSIEGAIVSLILALPSNDQAEILAEWMKDVEKVRYPDLSEAFEVWCYRTKSAKRRLVEGLERVGNATVSL